MTQNFPSHPLILLMLKIMRYGISRFKKLIKRSMNAWKLNSVFYPKKVLSPFKMVEGSGRLQMQAPVLLHSPVLQRSSSHSKEYTLSNPKSNETATTWHIPVVIDILKILFLREREFSFTFYFFFVDTVFKIRERVT